MLPQIALLIVAAGVLLAADKTKGGTNDGDRRKDSDCNSDHCQTAEQQSGNARAAELTEGEKNGTESEKCGEGDGDLSGDDVCRKQNPDGQESDRVGGSDAEIEKNAEPEQCNCRGAGRVKSAAGADV